MLYNNYIVHNVHNAYTVYNACIAYIVCIGYNVYNAMYALCGLHILCTVHTLYTTFTLHALHTLYTLYTQYAVYTFDTLYTLYAVCTMYTTQPMYALHTLFTLSIVCCSYTTGLAVKLSPRCKPQQESLRYIEGFRLEATVASRVWGISGLHFSQLLNNIYYLGWNIYSPSLLMLWQTLRGRPQWSLRALASLRRTGGRRRGAACTVRAGGGTRAHC